MVMTNKEKQARKRAKIKENPIKHKAIKEKDKLRKAQARDASKASEWFLYRTRENACIKALRHGKAAKSTVGKSEVSKSGASRQSLGKAIKRVKNVLPTSPRKRKVVVHEIAKGVGLKFVQTVANVTTENKLEQETRDKVEEYYQRDDISWQAPGIKVRVILRQRDEQGITVKVVLQSRYILVSQDVQQRVQ